jgi:tetratricopeptide (TPR) repeat protein
MIAMTACMVLNFGLQVYFMTTGLGSLLKGTSISQFNLPDRTKMQTPQIQPKRALPKPERKPTSILTKKQPPRGPSPNFQTELTTLNNRVKLDPKNVDAYYNRGLLYARNGQFEQAIRDFSEVIKLNPSDAEAYCNRGNAHFEAGKLNLALSDYNAGLKLKANDADLYYNRGLVYLEKGLKQLSLADLKRANSMGQRKAREYINKLSVQ